MKLTLAVVFLVSGLIALCSALFLLFSWHGLLLMGGALLTAVGLLGIQVDGGEQ